MADTKTLLRFIRKFKIDGETGCWNWTAALTGGYGSFQSGKAHRFSYRVLKGKIPKGAHVCHSCDNKKCVNPDHLWLGTAKDNLVDAARKGRMARGERQWQAKLKNEDVTQIRTNGKSSRENAEMFGISIHTVNDIRRRKTWKHV